MSLIDYAIACPKPLLVLAHPGSGTAFAVECLQRAGLDAHHQKISGELSDQSVIVSHRDDLDVEPESLARMIRDPMRTVYSVDALARIGGRALSFVREAFEMFVPKYAGDRIVRSNLWPMISRSVPTEPELRAIAASVAGWIMATGGPFQVGPVRTFRVEDIPNPDIEDYPRFNSHNVERCGSWDELTESLYLSNLIDVTVLETLSTLAFEKGYIGPKLRAEVDEELAKEAKRQASRDSDALSMALDKGAFGRLPQGEDAERVMQRQATETPEFDMLRAQKRRIH